MKNSVCLCIGPQPGFDVCPCEYHRQQLIKELKKLPVADWLLRHNNIFLISNDYENNWS